MTRCPGDDGELFEITIGRQLGSRSSNAFKGFERIDVPGDGMVLRGRVADQAALYGLLGRIRDFGIPLVGVRRIEPGHGSMSSGGVRASASTIAAPSNEAE